MNLYPHHRLAGPVSEAGAVVSGLIWTASIAASAYHGSKRHGGSIGWGLGWALLGALFGPITPAIAAGQGFGKCKYGCR